jgi:gliding motility-associated protein GldL
MTNSKNIKSPDREDIVQKEYISPKLQNFIFSIGAAIVVFGALCKVYHIPGLGWMLGFGLSIEVGVFIISAFQPIFIPPKEYDWSKVYPELTDDYDESGNEGGSTKKGQNGLNELIDQAGISPELLEKLKKGIQDLTNTAKGISEISNATLATELYVQNLGHASKSMNSFSEANNKATLSVERSLGNLVQSYEHSSKLISSSSEELAESFADSTKKINQQLASTSEKLTVSYKEFTESIYKDIAAINENSKNYSGELSRINSSMSSLNSSYELHLQNVKKLTESSSKSVTDQIGLQQMVNENLEEAKKYRQQTELMNKNLEALNQVYGNMLGAMIIKR